MAKRAMYPNTPLEERVDLMILLARMIYKKPEPIYELVSLNGLPMEEPIEMTRSEYRKLFGKRVQRRCNDNESIPEKSRAKNS